MAPYDTDSKLTGGLQEVEAVSQGSSIDVPKISASNDVVLVSGSNKSVRKIPIPSQDPNDPLNWSKWVKLGSLTTCCWFSVFSLLSVSGLGSIFEDLFGMYLPQGNSATAIVGLSTYPSLVMAFGCLIFLPLAMVIGRRPVFIAAIVMALASALGAGTSNTLQQHMTARIFLGIATGITESILPLIISDITFLDERGFYFGVYWAIQSGVGSALNISLSYIVAASSWRWYYWLFVITLAFGVVLVVFCSPESLYRRSPMSMDGVVVYTDEFGVTHTLSDAEAMARFGEIKEHTQDSANKQKRSYMSTLKPFNGLAPNAFQTWAGAYVKIAQCCTSPAVIFSLMAASISLGIGIGVSLIYSTVLTEGYGWSAASVGLFNVGVVPPSVVAMFYGGWVADKLNIWLATRNGGIHKPEHHLISLIVPFVAGVVGIVAMALTCESPQSYSAWGLVIGWAIYQFSFISIIIITTTFAAEALPHSAGPALIVVVGGKNVVSFAAAQGLVPMVAIYSYMKTFMILMGIFIGIFAIGIPVYFLNSRWRSLISRKKTSS